MKNTYKILVIKFDEKRPFGRNMSRWEDNIRMHLREIGWEVWNWIYLAHNRDQWRALLSTAMNHRVP
jgi:hypothetical protein